jgi:hypothetical protein
MNEELSNCCGAPPLGETCDEIGICSACKEGAGFEPVEKEENGNARKRN